MSNMLAVVLLATEMMMMMSVTSATDSFKVVSFRKLRKTENGPVMCALDAPNKTVTSSSLQNCSLGCVHDDACTGFNIKDADTCDLYDHKPKMASLISDCMFYQKIMNNDGEPVYCLEYGNEATSIPSQCCEVPYTLNGALYHNCTVNQAVSNDFGCYHTNGQWVTCQQPEDFTATYEETSSTLLSANPAVAVPLLTINGWILMQRKVTGGSVPFRKNWAAYRDGFGSATDDDNYWLGLDKVYRLKQLGSLRLRVEIQRTSGLWYSAEYSTFSISDEVGKYRLTVAGYSGDAGDALRVAASDPWKSNGMKFSTFDSDNDNNPGGNCAGDGWWWNWCSISRLNIVTGGTWTTGDVRASRMLVKIN